MGKKLLINARDAEESRVAVIEDGTLEDIYTETASREQIKGNIYKGTIVKVEPSFQAAFVNYGGKRDGFLPVGDVQPKYYLKQRSGSGPGGQPRIQDVLRRKQEVVVQVVKEAVGNKGAALTTHISLPGRYLVLMPHISGATRVSRKIEDEAERKKLKDILSQLEPPKNMGFIVRTAGLNRTKAEITSDLNYLVKLWSTIEETVQDQKSPALIYKERDLIIRTIRDYFTPDIEQVLIDNKEVYRQAREFVKMVMPRYLRRVKQYSDQQPIFSNFKIEEQIEAIYRRQVQLKSGGSIVIEPTEALVPIDVNSGRATRARGIEETALTTNLEAAVEIARQLRLRDLGGLVVIDFIDMYEAKHCSEVERTLRAELKKDKAKVQTSRISKFGLLELSRQRLRAAIQEGSYITCETCHGSGLVKSREVAALSLLRQLQDAVATVDYQSIRGRVPLDVVTYLLNQKRAEISRIEQDYDMTIILEGTNDLKDGEQELEFVKRPPKKQPPKEETDDGGDLPEEQIELATARAKAVAGESSDDDEQTPRRRRRSRGGRRRSRRRRDRDDSPRTAETNGQEAGSEDAVADEVKTEVDAPAAANVADKVADKKVDESQKEPRGERPGSRRRTPKQTEDKPARRSRGRGRTSARKDSAEERKEEKVEVTTPSVVTESTSSGNGGLQEAPATEAVRRESAKLRRQVDAPFVIEASSEPLPSEAAALAGGGASAADEPTETKADPKTARRRTTRGKSTATSGETAEKPASTTRRRKTTTTSKAKSAGAKTKRTPRKTSSTTGSKTTSRRASAKGSEAKKGAGATAEAQAPAEPSTSAEKEISGPDVADSP